MEGEITGLVINEKYVHGYFIHGSLMSELF